MTWVGKIQPQARLKILSLCEQFLLDAAVLIFVFPVLETVIQFGQKAVTRRLVLTTLLVSGVFFISAVVLGVIAVSREETP